MPKIHLLSIAYEQPDAASAANRLGAKVADAWDTFVAAVRAIDGCGEIEIIDKVIRPTGPKPRLAAAAPTDLGAASPPPASESVEQPAPEPKTVIHPRRPRAVAGE